MKCKKTLACLDKITDENLMNEKPRVDENVMHESMKFVAQVDKLKCRRFELAVKKLDKVSLKVDEIVTQKAIKCDIEVDEM